MLSKYIMMGTLAVGLTLAMGSCSDDLDKQSIFEDVSEELDSASASYQLDKYCEDTYLKKYNVQFRYRMQDVGADMNYNLVPASYVHAVDIAVLTDYLWFQVYDKVCGTDFLKQYGPRIIHLIGSSAYNPSSGTEILGLAEGGLKVSLFKVNSINVNDFNTLNEYYFKTMHHEFGHILHQTKTYPVEFDQISKDFYDPMSWQDQNMDVCYSKGFTSDYASSQGREDFAETIANYITKTDAEWNAMLVNASKGWNQRYDADGIPVTDEETGKPVCDEGEDLDGVDGRAVILQKVDIVRKWFKNSWGIDLDALRAEVQARQTSYDIEELRKQVYDIPVGGNASTQNK